MPALRPPDNGWSLSSTRISRNAFGPTVSGNTSTTIDWPASELRRFSRLPAALAVARIVASDVPELVALRRRLVVPTGSAAE